LTGAEGDTGVLATIKRELTYVGGLFRTLPWVRGVLPDSTDLACDDLEAAVDKHGDRPAIVFEGRSLSYRELDALANRYAHWALAQGLARGDTVALFAPNRLEYVPFWFGLMKVGVVVALINNNLTGRALRHCLEIARAAHAVVDAETGPALEAIRGDLETPLTPWCLDRATPGARDLPAALEGVSDARPDRASVRAGMVCGDNALFIYTSGTTGLPKAARITHVRARLYMRSFAGATDAQAEDRIYVTLPLYHATGGFCAVGAALLNGGAVLLRKKFSASHFWDDVVDLKATMFVYIGELCRYLVNHPPHPKERAHGLRKVFGNGLRPDIWTEFQSRFAIPRILEFYGATEGNIALMNYDGRPGAVGRVPGYMRKIFNVRLVRFDVESEQPVRGPDGFCIECEPGEAGEAVGLIGQDARTGYSGYADKAASERKILRDVFERGDAWFRSGDLMRRDADGYFYFVDRIGDTFRWKGENVSTNEVAERLSGAPGVTDVNVYGVAVPGAEGRAGMAALSVEPGFDITAFATQADRELPAYARPLFVRVLPEIEVTGTFKHRKVDLVRDGFDPAKVEGPLWFRVPGEGFAPLDPALHARIVGGEFRF
jgi:fatty-acyl-CoA synthase